MPDPQRPEGRQLRAGWPLSAALIAVLVIAAVVIALRTRAPVGGPPFAPPQQPETVYMSRIRSLETVTGAADPARFANYRVELSNLPVAETAGRAFWVTDREGRRVLVIPNNPGTPAQAVAPGSTVSITGAVRTPNSPERAAERHALEPEVAQLAAGQTVYLRADSIREGSAVPEAEPQAPAD